MCTCTSFDIEVCKCTCNTVQSRHLYCEHVSVCVCYRSCSLVIVLCTIPTGSDGHVIMEERAVAASSVAVFIAQGLDA